MIKFNSFIFLSYIIVKIQNPSHMHIFDIHACSIDLQQQFPILKTVGAVIHTIGVSFCQLPARHIQHFNKHFFPLENLVKNTLKKSKIKRSDFPLSYILTPV